METTTKILIADDHRMMLDGLQAMLRSSPRYQVVLEAMDGMTAWELVRAHREELNLVITDISMPGIDGIELSRRIKKEFPEIKVLVISMHNDAGHLQMLLEVEAEGYILKESGKSELLEALDRIMGGQTHYNSKTMLESLRATIQQRKDQEIRDRFTPRELEVLALIADEKSSEEIAEKLFISRRTVDTHRVNLLQKSGCKTVVGLLKFAWEHHLVQYP